MKLGMGTDDEVGMMGKDGWTEGRWIQKGRWVERGGCRNMRNPPKKPTGTVIWRES